MSVMIKIDSTLFSLFFQAEPVVTNNPTATSALTSGRGSIPASLQLSFPDQLYRQAKIDEENRRLKKKSKGDANGTKKGKKSSKKSDSNPTSAPVDENDEDLYPTIKVVRGGELPEGARESDHEDEGVYSGKNKKQDPHRALNIDLDEQTITKMSSPTVAPIIAAPPTPAAEPVKKSSTTTTVTEKPKKKKTKEEKATSSKGKSKRERSGYNELGSPADDEQKEQRVASPAAPVSPAPPTPITIVAPAATEEKPKKKKTKEKKSTKESSATTTAAAPASPLLFDMMSDDINPTGPSTFQTKDEHIYKSLTQSEHLAIVRRCFCFFITFFIP